MSKVLCDIKWLEAEMRYTNARRRDMAKKVRDFLDIPAKLPVRKYTKAELALMREARLLNNLKEHVRWLSLIHTWNLQSPNMPSCWYVNL